MYYHKNSCLFSINTKSILDYMSYVKQTKKQIYKEKNMNILKQKRSPKHFLNIGGIIDLL